MLKKLHTLFPAIGVLTVCALLLCACGQTAPAPSGEPTNGTSAESAVVDPTGGETAVVTSSGVTTYTIPTNTPTPEPTTTPLPARNDLRDFFSGDVTLVLPDDPTVYLETQAGVFTKAVEDATGVKFTAKPAPAEETGEEPADEPAEEPGEEPTPTDPAPANEPTGGLELHFGMTADTPSNLKKGLGNADYSLVREGDRLYLAVGSDYALGRAAQDVLGLLDAHYLELPYTGRAEKEEQVTVIRAATFNIQNGAGVAHVFKKLASAIRSSGADIIGLQEVDMNTGRNGRRDTMKELADNLGFKYYEFSKAIDYNGGEYGTGVLSRYPIVSYETIALPRGGGDESRSCGHAVININGVRIDFFNTHLTLADSNRPQQWATIVGQISGLEHVILTGDLNRDGTEDYDYFFGKDYNYVNGNNVIGFAEGCTLVTERAEPEEPDSAVVERLYALENGQSLEGTYTLTGVVKGVVNTYLDSDDVTIRIIVDGMKDKQITCYKLKGGQNINEGDTVTVTGTLVNRVYKNEHTPDVSWYDSCPGYGALDNVISSPFFTQIDYDIENKKVYSDHFMLWADLAFPTYALEGGGFGEEEPAGEN